MVSAHARCWGPVAAAVTSWAAADEGLSVHHTCPYTAHPAISHQTRHLKSVLNIIFSCLIEQRQQVVWEVFNTQIALSIKASKSSSSLSSGVTVISLMIFSRSPLVLVELILMLTVKSSTSCGKISFTSSSGISTSNMLSLKTSLFFTSVLVPMSLASKFNSSWKSE